MALALVRFYRQDMRLQRDLTAHVRVAWRLRSTTADALDVDKHAATLNLARCHTCPFHPCSRTWAWPMSDGTA